MKTACQGPDLYASLARALACRSSSSLAQDGVGFFDRQGLIVKRGNVAPGTIKKQARHPQNRDRDGGGDEKKISSRTNHN